MAEWKPGDRVWSASIGKKGVVIKGGPYLDPLLTPVRFQGEAMLRLVAPLSLVEAPEQRSAVTPSAILREAADLLDGERQDEYGDVFENHKRIASEWSSILGHEVTGGQVAACMVAVKRSRLTQNPRHHDSHVDALAYTAIKSAFDLRPQ